MTIDGVVAVEERDQWKQAYERERAACEQVERERDEAQAQRDALNDKLRHAFSDAKLNAEYIPIGEIVAEQAKQYADLRETLFQAERERDEARDERRRAEHLWTVAVEQRARLLAALREAREWIAMDEPRGLWGPHFEILERIDAALRETASPV